MPSSFPHPCPKSACIQESGSQPVATCAFREKERPAYTPYVGKEVVLGVRPEDIKLGPAAPEPAGKDEASFQAVVDMVEPMGAETNFYLQSGSHILICQNRVMTDQGGTGHRLQFVMNTTHAQLFDPVTTERIV